VRNAFGNTASVISADQVANVRADNAQPTGFWKSSELQQKYPE